MQLSHVLILIFSIFSFIAARIMNTMTLQLYSSILRFFFIFGNLILSFTWLHQHGASMVSVYWNLSLLVQDDAIRNLFSAKTIHEYSAQSLLTFLVLHLFSQLTAQSFGQIYCSCTRLFSLNYFTASYSDQLCCIYIS